MAGWPRYQPISRQPAPSKIGLACQPVETPQPEKNFEFKNAKLGIEVTTEAQEDVNQNIDFGDSPVHCVCPHCERSVITFLDHEASGVTWLLAFIVWFSLGWITLWVLPLLWPAFKDVVHHCPRCLNVIARQSRIKLPTFRSEVMTLKVGSCAVVLARKYVIILAGLILVIGSVCVLRSTVSLRAQAPGDHIPRGPDSALTWEDFIRYCGPRQSLRHRNAVTRAFEDKFRRRTFKWQGEVVVIREGFDMFLLKTKSVVMVRMYPQRFPRRDIPDVALLFGEDRNREVSSLTPGDWIKFEGTMTSHGHRGDPEVMMMWHVEVAPKPHPLSSNPTLEAIEAGKHPHDNAQKTEEPVKTEGSEAKDNAADSLPKTDTFSTEDNSGGDRSKSDEAPSSAEKSHEEAPKNVAEEKPTEQPAEKAPEKLEEARAEAPAKATEPPAAARQESVEGSDAPRPEETQKAASATGLVEAELPSDSASGALPAEGSRPTDKPKEPEVRRDDKEQV